jgi:RecA/RadA recombinase
MGKNSHTKFIPQNYLFSSINDRFELIRGLMDTDGYNDNGKSAEYSTVSYLLSIHVAELLRSLGYMVKTKERMTKCNGQEFKSFRLYISGNDVNKLFKLSRKIFYSKRKKPKLFKTIKKVEVVRKEETQCIFINHQDHLYLTDSFNVTHNTTTAMQIAANCQKLGRNIIYIDAEGRFKDMNFQVDGLDPEKMLIMAPEDKPIPAEKFLEWAYMMMSHSDNYGAVLIIDSISSLIPEKELDGDFTAGRAGLPKVLSVFTKKVGQLLPRQRGLVIAITHYIANTSGFGKAKMADGGNKIQYQADTRMEIAGGGENTPAVKFWEDDEGKRVGQVVNWKIICSSMGPPGGQVQSYIKYGHGIDRTQEILMLALDLGLIDKSGAWFTCSFIQLYKDLAKQIFPDINVENQEELFSVKGFKFQGQNKLYDFLKSHPVLVDTLEKMIKENLT